jgi:hypothetical protein
VSGAFLDSPIVAMAGLTLATAGVLSATATFWAVPTAVLSGAGAAAGIAWINSIGNLAGQLSPTLVGVLRARFDDTATGLYGLGLSLLVAGIVVAVTAPRASRG